MKDIRINTKTKDLQVDVIQSEDSLSVFRWLIASNAQEEIRGEIKVASLENLAGVVIERPYKNVYKNVVVRFVNEDGEFLTNPESGTEWFPVFTSMFNQEHRQIKASEFGALTASRTLLLINGGEIDAYDADAFDMRIGNAERQTINLLLLCNPTNNLRYPLAGVGLMKWVNAPDVNSGELAEVIRTQFANDGMAVRTANYNYDTQTLENVEVDFFNL